MFFAFAACAVIPKPHITETSITADRKRLKKRFDFFINFT